jgi:RecA/RadA recombinase
MAKKVTDFSFKNMRGMMENISKKTSILIDDDNTIKTYINTDIYMLNALLSKSILKGGIPKNRFTVFAGPEAVGKSYLCYNIARNAQKEGYSVIYIDTEYSIELSELPEFGIDISPDKFMLIRSNKIEDLKMMLAQSLGQLKEEKFKGNTIQKTIIFLDSIGQLASKKEIDDAIEGKNKADMTRAKAIKSLFRIITADLGFLNIPLVATNHVYMTMDLFPKAVQSGGKGVEYSASTIVYLTKAKLKTGQEDDLDLGSSGIVVTALARKNRNAKPKKIKFEINHTSGTNKFKGLEFFCTPENFKEIGIAKVKKNLDKKTGEITYTTGGTKYYVEHLDKSFFEKQLYNSKIFTDDILNKLEPIIYKYFSYFSQEEMENIQLEMDDKYDKFETDIDIDSELDMDSNASPLFD